MTLRWIARDTSFNVRDLTSGESFSTGVQCSSVRGESFSWVYGQKLRKRHVCAMNDAHMKRIIALSGIISGYSTIN